jgi:mRNA-degrading endonuclease HigB of HigAB toxin-antitoxin module
MILSSSWHCSHRPVVTATMLGLLYCCILPFFTKRRQSTMILLSYRLYRHRRSRGRSTQPQQSHRMLLSKSGTTTTNMNHHDVPIKSDGHLEGRAFCSDDDDDDDENHSIVWNGYCLRYFHRPMVANTWSTNNDKDDSNLLYSWFHCIGDNHYMSRTCQFHNICLDITTNEYYLFPSPEEMKVIHALQNVMNTNHHDIHHLTNYDYVAMSSVSYKSRKVALTSIDHHTDQHHHDHLLWFPTIITSSEQYESLFHNGYYVLPSTVVVLPTIQSTFDRYNRNDVVMLLWKELYSIFLLLQSVNLDDNRRYQRLFLSIDQENQPLRVHPNLYPFFGVRHHPTNGAGHPKHWKSKNDAESNRKNDRSRKSNIICIPNSVAGVGIISSMEANDSKNPKLTTTITRTSYHDIIGDTFPLHRGVNMLDFRQAMINTILSQQEQKQVKSQRAYYVHDHLDLQLPIQITISIPSVVQEYEFDHQNNNIRIRYLDLVHQLYEALHEEDVVHVIRIATSSSTSSSSKETNQNIDRMMDVSEQALFLTKSHAHITLSSGYDDPYGTVLSTFLPIGASLIVFHSNNCNENNTNNTSCYYERQVLDSIGYFHLKWISLTSSSLSLSYTDRNTNNRDEKIIQLVVNHIQDGLDRLHE